MTSKPELNSLAISFINTDQFFYFLASEVEVSFNAFRSTSNFGLYILVNNEASPFCIAYSRNSEDLLSKFDSLFAIHSSIDLRISIALSGRFIHGLEESVLRAPMVRIRETDEDR